MEVLSLYFFCKMYGTMTLATTAELQVILFVISLFITATFPN